MEIDMSARGVEKQIRKLREAGIIKRIGADRSGYWEITITKEDKVNHISIFHPSSVTSFSHRDNRFSYCRRDLCQSRKCKIMVTSQPFRHSSLGGSGHVGKFFQADSLSVQCRIYGSGYVKRPIHFHFNIIRSLLKHLPKKPFRASSVFHHISKVCSSSPFIVAFLYVLTTQR